MKLFNGVNNDALSYHVSTHYKILSALPFKIFEIRPWLNHTQAYSVILRSLCNLLIFITLPYSEHRYIHLQIQSPVIVTAAYLVYLFLWTLHMMKPGKFGILEYLELIQNYSSTNIMSSVIFTKIGKPCVTLEIQNPAVMKILEYSEP